MIKKMMLGILSAGLLMTSCKKAADKLEEIKERIVNAYWKSVDDLVIEIKEDKGMVVDFGDSPLGSNENVFKLSSDPYIKNIVRTGPDTWTGDVVKATYDNNKKLVSFTYQSTTIKVSTDANGKEQLSLSKSDPGSNTWSILENYTPPTTPPAPTTCDITTTTLKDDMNTITRIDDRYPNSPTTNTKFEVQSGWKRSSGFPCYYAMIAKDFDGMANGGRDLFVYFSEKPQPGKTYQLIGTEWASTLGSYTNAAAVGFNSWSSKNGGTVTVSAASGKLVVKATNLVLDYSFQSFDYKVSFTIVGQ